MVRRRILRHRRGLAAALVGLAVLLFAQALRPPEAATVPVMAAATALPAGHVIAASDLGFVDWPAEHRPPSGFTDPTELVGRITLTAIDAGEALSPNRVLSPGMLDGVNGSTDSTGGRVVAVGVRLADPGEAGLLRPGDLIDLLAARGAGPVDGDHSGTGPTTAETVARGVRVLAIPRADDQGSEGLLGDDSGGAGGSGTLIALAVDEPTSRRIAAAAANSRLSVALLPPTATPAPAGAPAGGPEGGPTGGPAGGPAGAPAE